MKKKRFSDLEFLKSGDFPKFPNLGLYCHVKFPDPSGGMPKKFGVVFNHTPEKVYLIDAKGNLTKEVETFDSIEALLREGWIVD